MSAPHSMIYWPPRGTTGDGVSGDLALANVHEVRCSPDRTYLHGRMLKKDGTAGPSRGCVVDERADQPEWLAAIIADARARYEVES